MRKQFIGDINNDGNLSAIDMLTIFRYKTGEVTLTDEEIKRADVDGNGKIEIADALKIQKHIMGEIIVDGVIE